VVAPFAAGNKDSLIQRIMIHTQVHEQALAAGLPIVDVEDSYNLALELAKATDMAGNKIYTDPNTVEPPPPPPDHTATALDIEAQKVQAEAADEARQAEIDRLKIETDSADKRYQTDINAQVQLVLADKKGEGQLTLEGVKADLKNAPIELGNQAIIDTSRAVSDLTSSMTAAISELNQAIDEIKSNASAPRKLIRENGKIVGAEVNGRVIRLEDG